jgi:hypothetical protein
MNSLIRIIGSIVLSLILYAIPILLVCSFFLKWGFYINFVLIAASLTEIYFLIDSIFSNSKEEI